MNRSRTRCEDRPAGDLRALGHQHAGRPRQTQEGRRELGHRQAPARHAGQDCRHGPVHCRPECS